MPGLTTLQYVVDRLTPYRLEAVLEDSLKESLAEINIGSRQMVLRRFSTGK